MKLTRKNKQDLYDRVSKYLEDISKLIFAGVVLSSIMKEDVGTWWLVGLGFLVGAVILYGSYKAYIKSKI
ncbi:MAG: hypothetical protein IJT46_04515 [Bacteroidaceae bacterium]|nr:hypothetical protein [Bacteroidaceae bacterium]MBQ8009733.1 hypothetical protein [Bacteroidaceae bacterium]